MKATKILTVLIIVSLVVTGSLFARETSYVPQKSTKDYNKQLVTALDSEVMNIRAHAAKQLGERKVKSATSQLISLLNSDEEQSVRITAGIALAKISGKNAITTLEKHLQTEQNETAKHVLTGVVQKLKAGQKLDS